MPIYNVTIKTGDVGGAGTDANVSITLYGDLGQSSDYLLDKSGYDDFERNAQDTYPVRTDRDLGNLEKIRLRHDNTGSAPGWYVDWVQVQTEDKQAIWRFTTHRWLASDEDDRRIDVTFPVDTGIPQVIIDNEKTEFIMIARKDEVYDNLGSDLELNRKFEFSETYSNEVRYQKFETTEVSASLKVNVSVPIDIVQLGMEASTSVTQKLESTYGRTDSAEKTYKMEKPITVPPYTVLIVSQLLIQETRVGTIRRGTRSMPFQVPIGEPQSREAQFSYKKGDSVPDDAQEMAKILQRAGRAIPWK